VGINLGIHEDTVHENLGGCLTRRSSRWSLLNFPH